MTSWRDDVRAVCQGLTRVRADEVEVAVGAALAAGGLEACAADLALVYAVTRGDAVALRRFDELVGPELHKAARAIDRDPAFVDEVCQQTRVRLLVGEPARLLGYRGLGPLRAWVAIAAQRVALNLRRESAGRSEDVLVELVDREPDPELRHLKTLYRTEFREALSAAVAGVTDRQRALLRLRFVDQLELAQIGKLYRVHESTASRWLSAALEAIGGETRARLIARLAVSSVTADSVARMVRSQLDLSIARLLG
jgi:RNA polymerase sigma-70 factor (ECF subfamily)